MQAFLLPGHTTKLRLTHWRNDDKVIFRKKEEIFLEQCLFYVDLPWLFYSAFLRTRSASACASTLYSSPRKGWFTALYYNVELHTNSLSFLVLWKCLPLKYTPLTYQIGNPWQKLLPKRLWNSMPRQSYFEMMTNMFWIFMHLHCSNVISLH